VFRLVPLFFIIFHGVGLGSASHPASTNPSPLQRHKKIWMLRLLLIDKM